MEDVGSGLSFLEAVKAHFKEIALTTKLQEGCAWLTFLLKFGQCQFKNTTAIRVGREQARDHELSMIQASLPGWVFDGFS